MMRTTLLALGAILLVSGTASAQGASARDDGRVSLIFGGGFGGESALHFDPDIGNIDTISGEDDLDPSITLGFRYTHPLHTYVTLAAEMRFVFWHPDGQDDRNTFFDFGVMPAARYVFDVGSLELEPYLGLPLGFTVNRLDEDPLGDLGQASVGFHLGLLAGLAVQLPIGLGVFTELGWLHHQVFDSDDVGSYRLVNNQFALHFGVSYAF